MKVLITGAAGRVGSAICEALRAAGDAVVGLDRQPSAWTDVQADIGDEPAVRRALDGADAVVHVAALHAPHVGQASEAAFERINVQGSVQLARWAVQAGVRRFVFTSTTALYGHASTPADRAGWVDEDTLPQPRTVYHRSKLAAEAALAALADEQGLALTVLRMSRCFPEAADAMVVYRLHRGVDARDVAQAHVLALRQATPSVRTFVISGATPFRPEDAERLKHDAAALLAERAPDLAAAFAARGWALPASIDRVYTPQRAQQTLGWQPQFGFESVMRQCDEGSPEVLPPAAFNSPHGA
jgi:UDP-glucose 4-epimerase